jgi:DNA (cytosine-5)-methyltransferase 3A
LVSAQNRQRFYAFNWTVEQPEDRGILLKDILESNTAQQLHYLTQKEMDYMVRDTKGKYSDRWTYLQKPGESDKALCITANVHKGVPYNVVAEPVGDTNGKSYCLTAAYRFGIEPDRTLDKQQRSLVAEPVYGSMYATDNDDKKVIVYEVKDGLITIKGKQYPIKLKDGFYIIRKLTPVECERLQTLPDGYTNAVSNSQRYKGLGNGWTAEIIIHILNGALKDVPKDEEIVVLSMYDGIGTGRYCLDKMGFTNVKYFAYEIDKYAKKVAMSNYPDIIQLGDAFDVRRDGWNIKL